MVNMKLLRHKLTGIAGMYPEHFAEYDIFDEVLDLEEPCLDCVVELDEVEEDEDEDLEGELDGSK